MSYRAPDPIAAALRAERLRRGLSLRQVGELMGHNSHQTVWQWEHGTNSPLLVSLRDWATALGYDLALIERDDA